MKREKGSFQEDILPLSLALVCVCGNQQATNAFINCNEDGVPFSIWEAWSEDGFQRPEGFAEPPKTPYGFCVICPVCGRFYSEKEMELTGEALVSGTVDPDTEIFSRTVKTWGSHNEDFFRKHVGHKKTTEGKTAPVSKNRPRSDAPRPKNAPDLSGWDGKEWIEGEDS